MSHPGSAAVDEQAWPADAVEVGRILGAWGVKGEIKVKPFSSDPQALFSTKRWFVAPPDDGVPRPRAVAPASRLLRIVRAREQGDAIVAQVQELEDRDAALALSGCRVFVSRASFPTPDSDEFYWVDLVGLSVSNREGQALGEVEGLIETGPHCVLRLNSLDAEGQQRMIPFVASYIDQVDLAKRILVVDWPADY